MPQLDGKCKYKKLLVKKSLVRIPELAINPLGDRIVHAFFYESKSQGEEKVDFKVRSQEE